MKADTSIIFGPVPSRRLGRSLGLNNIPPKICSYSCIYCQLGRTANMQPEQQAFYESEDILRAVQDKLKEVERAGETIDYLTFVADGEPTLDINLAREIDQLKHFGLPIAVITNTSLVWQPAVRQALMAADWVSLKVDSVEENLWRKIDRPHPLLNLTSILDGALAFADAYTGKLVTETMLLADMNDTDHGLGATAEFISLLQPTTAYLSIPTRPPAEKWAKPPDEHVINRAYQIFEEKVNHVEYLTGYEGSAFAFTGNAGEDILSITAVHPMRRDAIDEFLKRAGENWDIVQRMVEKSLLIETEYGGNTYYMRRLSKRSRRNS